MGKSKEEILSRYIPADYVASVVALLNKYPVRFRIVKPRKTKLGDFRYDPNSSHYEITVNGNLNPYAFLITTMHEFAHLIAYDTHGTRIMPHGKEWKTVFSELLSPLAEHDGLPADIRSALKRSIRNVKASSCTDQQLQRVLMKYDENPEAGQLLENINKNSIFELNGKQFIKGELRRTRFVCTDASNGRKYLINALAQVKPMNDGEQ